MTNLQYVHGSASLTPFTSLHMLSKKDQLWRIIESMRKNNNQVDIWLCKVDDVVDRGSEFWDFLPDTLILPNYIEKWELIKPGLWFVVSV